MKRKNVALIGSSGRMGQEILAILSDSKKLCAKAGVSRESAKGVKSVKTLKELSAKDIDVVIDFSTAALFPEVVEWCLKSKKPLVSGTTGISDKDKKALEKAAKTIPVLWAPNMSLGIAVMKQMFQAFRELEGFEFQVEEFHHKHKKDKPSGTALALQTALQKEVDQKLPEPLAIRGGGIFGIHRVFAMGEEEVITIEHTALNRRVFAKGAVRAAEWLVSQKAAGQYHMTDVLG